MRTRQVWRDGGGVKAGVAPNCGLRRAALTQSRKAAKPPSLFIPCASAPLHCNTPGRLSLAKILPRMARMTRITLEQKGTKATKEGLFFVAFVCSCGNYSPMGTAMESSSSVKSVKSVVQFLWLRLAARRLPAFAPLRWILHADCGWAGRQRRTIQRRRNPAPGL